MAALALIATGVGALVSAAGTIAAGKAQQQAADYEAAQLDVQAKDERAAAQAQALDERRRQRLALSALTARSAASGFTATDPTTMKLAGDIAKYGEYRAQSAQYVGNSRAAGLNAQATGARLSGQAAVTGSYYGAAGTIIGGIGGMADTYARYSRPSTVNNYYYGTNGVRQG
jgi:hypothetical protein